MALTTITNSMVSVNAIQGTLIADNAITAVHIATNAVSGTLIADNAITATHIAQNSITVTQLADDCVESDKIADGIITTNHLNKAMISSQTEVAVATGDYVLLGDTSDSNNLKKAPISSILAGTLTTAAQTNITSVGTLTGLTGGTGDLVWDSSTFVVDSSTDRVGIGTASPAVELHIHDEGGLAAIRFSGTASSADTFTIGQGIAGVTNAGFSIYDVEATANRLVIDTSGRVGIGESSPVAKVHIQGSGTSGQVTSSLILENNQSGTAGLQITGTAGSSHLDFMYGGGPSTGTNTLTTGLSMMLEGASAGKVGIGTTSPARPLHVFAAGSDAGVIRIENTGGGNHVAGIELISGHGSWGIYNSDTVGDALEFRDDSASATRMIITTAGNVGIGTTNPSTALQVSGTVTATYIAAGNSVFDGSGGAGGYSLKATYSGATKFQVQNTGNVTISGALSKGSGSFRIDHPLESKKDTHHLVHSFVEAPQADNIYRGKVDLVDGSATVNIDTVAGMTEGTFVALNTDVQCFTTNESDWDAVKGSVSGNLLTISCQNTSSTATVSWLVIGERQDQHMKDTDWTDADGKVIVEPTK